MSLTNFVKAEKISEKMSVTFRMPPCKISSPILAPPSTGNPPLMGTAFDYAMRFWLYANHPNAVTTTWIAEKAIDDVALQCSFIEEVIDLEEDKRYMQIETKGGKYVYESVNDVLKALPSSKAQFDAQVVVQDYRQGFLDSAYTEYIFLTRCSKVVQIAKKRLSKCHQTKTLNDDLLKSALDLARLDDTYRSGIIPTDLETYEEYDIQDLRNLISTIPSQFSLHKEVFLNPECGQASNLVGGADADLILDGQLIDIKTLRNPSLSLKSWHQLVGYAILADLAREDNSDYPSIQSLGIYFSRHGALWTIPASEVYDNPRYGEFKTWFVGEAERRYRHSFHSFA